MHFHTASYMAVIVVIQATFVVHVCYNRLAHPLPYSPLLAWRLQG